MTNPIGALNPKKLEELQKNLDENEIPYIYPFHYSSSNIVLFYLTRTHPLYFLNFQGKNFGPADRLFFSMKECWNTTFHLGADVKELIPEFYSGDGEFLKNINGLDLGITQSNIVVDDVVLPKWAKVKFNLILVLSKLYKSYASSS